MASFEGEDEAGLEVPEAMVTVGSFESPMEAQLAKGMLEAAGVRGFLTGENVNNLLQAAFGVQIQVRAEDEAAARELLERAEHDEVKASGDEI